MQPQFSPHKTPLKNNFSSDLSHFKLIFFSNQFYFFLIFQKYLSFEPIDQFSSVVPFWKPHNVSFLLRRGAGPPAPPYCRPWLEGYNFRTFLPETSLKSLFFWKIALFWASLPFLDPTGPTQKYFFLKFFILKPRIPQGSLKLLLFWGQFGPQKKVFQKHGFWHIFTHYS